MGVINPTLISISNSSPVAYSQVYKVMLTVDKSVFTKIGYSYPLIHSLRKISMLAVQT